MKSKTAQIAYLLDVPISQWILTELNVLKNNGFNVFICLTYNTKESRLEKHFNYSAAKCHIYIFNIMLFFLNHPINSIKILRKWKREFGTRLTIHALFLSKLLRKKQIIHVHAHFASASTSTAMIVNDLTGIPFSFTAHAYDIFRNDVNNDLLKEKITRARFIRCVSRYNKIYLENLYGCHNDKMLVIHCGVDTKIFSFQSRINGTFTILSVSNLVEKKGLEYLIKAVKILKDDNYSLEALIIGDGPEKENILNLINTLNLEREVSLLGKIPHESLPNIHAKTNLFVLPCIVAKNRDMDGIPVALMEAMLSGIPVISTKISGIPELIIDHETGLLVKEKDEYALADAIKKMIKNEKFRNSIGLAGRERVYKEFNIENITRLIISTFNKYV